jgi:hypothetical protein
MKLAILRYRAYFFDWLMGAIQRLEWRADGWQSHAWRSFFALDRQLHPERYANPKIKSSWDMSSFGPVLTESSIVGEGVYDRIIKVQDSAFKFPAPDTPPIVFHSTPRGPYTPEWAQEFKATADEDVDKATPPASEQTPDGFN